MHNNNRFLMHSHEHLQGLSALFNHPQPGPAPLVYLSNTVNTTVIRPITSARATAGAIEGSESSISNDSVYETQTEEPRRRVNTHANPPTGRPTLQSPLPPRLPAESEEQYEAQYDTWIRHIDQTQNSWNRAYNEDNPAPDQFARDAPSHMPSPETAIPRDYRVDHDNVEHVHALGSAFFPGPRCFLHVRGFQCLSEVFHP
ncbi:hypothetical protein FIBSPDRAFT_969299 [Athelia psychrophila]|uniref:Uncharacterized protein n=1 Tax=Athelia psychrophila TaxID=1759441 RepID=A0A167TNA7_9AGAM|nr:hypothetical protein FIBSPDRAFT_969299 [Fibularhizoctonia sp. CBS 109695]